MKIYPDMGIPLSDGTRLSARVWMPDCAKTEPVPAILEYLPYRKSDGTAARDHGMHLHFARAGYACLRVDRRGCGDSEGLFDDEYSEQELSDGVEIINWIAEQPWCTGRVGMQGISWGGFNSVQIAARAPKALRAVISIGTTVDRYHDDIHYKGGVQLSENIGWAATVSSWFSMPPDPELRPDWREVWLERLENAPFLASRWIRHPNRDAYWKHGSICEDFGAIKAAVLVMGGLHDGYRNAMSAMLEGINAPVKGIAGPWSHKYPNISTIGPSIDYLGEALRWWDHWLKDIDTGVVEDPDYRVYIMDSIKPEPSLDYREGSWQSCHDWPSTDTERENFEFRPAQNSMILADIETDLACGRNAGEFFPFGFGPGELPDDQTHDDALSAVFDTPGMDTERCILGAPSVKVALSADVKRAQMIVRLCDLRPDGTSALVTLGLLNLRHREGFDAPKDLVPAQNYEVSLTLDQTAYRLPKGHKLRIAISPSYWPYAWPEGQMAKLAIQSVDLTVPWFNTANQAASSPFSPPAEMEKRAYEEISAPIERKTWDNDPATGRMTLEIYGDHGRQKDLENGLITHSTVSERWVIDRNDAASAQVEIIWTRSLGRGDWEVSSTVTTRMRGTEDSFEIEQITEAMEGADLVFTKTEIDTVPR